MMLLLACLIILAALYALGRYRRKRAETMYPPRGKMIEVEGIRLHYYEKGSGIPVVLLHGGVLAGSDFKQVLEIAAAEGFRAIAFDRPGYGYSERPKREKVTPVVQARLLHGALRKMGIAQPILVGHSWSGLLTLSYALDYPRDVAGIAILGGAMFKAGYPAENGDIISRLITMPLIGKVMLHTLLPAIGPWLARQILKATFAPEPVPEQYGREAAALWLRPAQFLANREDILAFAPLAEKLEGRYDEIEAPVVIVIGKNDPFPTKEQSHRLHRLLKSSRLVELSDVAHMIPQNHPRAVVNALRNMI